jgi:hypothetical protein
LLSLVECRSIDRKFLINLGVNAISLHNSIPPVSKPVSFNSFFSLLLVFAFLFLDEIPFVQQ